MSFNSMPCAMYEYEAAKVAIAQNERIHTTHQSSTIYTPTSLPPERIHRTHQSSAIYPPTHLPSPISAGDALSLAQAGFFLTHETADPCLPLLASGRYERRAGNKRAHDDLLLQGAFECKRQQCLMPGLAVVNGTNASPCLMPGLAAVNGMERLGKPSPRRSGEMEDLKIPNACHQNVGSFFAEEVKLNLSLVGLRTENMLGHVDTVRFDGRRSEKTASISHEHSRKFVHTHLQQARMPSHGENMLEVGLHNHPASKFRNNDANQDPLVAQAVINNRGNVEKNRVWPHVCRTSSDINDQISDVPCFLPIDLVEKKTTASQEDDNVFSPRQAQRGKQSSLRQAQQGEQSSPSFAKPNSKVLVDVTNKFQVTATPDAKKHMEEDDTHRLSQRHKQIEFGKNTLGYERYIELVPKSKRKGKDPRTPNPKQVCSKRSWDGQIRQWRRLLHNYDPPAEDGEELAEDMTLLKSSKKNEKLEPGKDDIDSKIHNKENLSRLQESKVARAIGGVANSDDGLSIYEDWMDC